MSGIKNVTNGLAYHTDDLTLNTESKLLNAQKAFLSSSANSADAQEFCLNAFKLASGKDANGLKVESNLTGNPKNGLAYIGSNFAVSQRNYLSQAQISSVAQNFCSNAFNMAAGVNVSESLSVKFLSGLITPSRGRVIDGAIRGATVKQMQLNKSVTIGVSDSDGFFRTTKEDGAQNTADTSINSAALIATGGIDVVTGLNNVLTLKSSSGSVISMLTTLVTSILEVNTSLNLENAMHLASNFFNISKNDLGADYITLNLQNAEKASIQTYNAVVLANILSGGSNLSKRGVRNRAVVNNLDKLLHGLGIHVITEGSARYTHADLITELINNTDGVVSTDADATDIWGEVFSIAYSKVNGTVNVTKLSMQFLEDITKSTIYNQVVNSTTAQEKETRADEIIARSKNQVLNTDQPDPDPEPEPETLQKGININTLTKEVYLKDDGTLPNFEGIPQQIIFNFDSAQSVKDIFNLGDVKVATVDINSGNVGGGPQYVDTLSIQIGAFGNKATLNPFSNPINLVKNNETLIFTFLSDISKITSTTLTGVTYGGNSINVNII